ncbi:MAG: S1C family serine protease [Kofleriaceae bacterium]
MTRVPHHPVRDSHLTKILAVLLLVVAGALVYTVMQQRHQLAPVPVSVDPKPVSQRPDDKLGADEQSTIEVFEKFSASVVHVTSLETRRDKFTFDVTEIPQGVGTGFVWDRAGHIVTNAHVIEHGSRAVVTLNDGTRYPAKIVDKYPNKDLAVLKIEAPASKLVELPIGQSSSLKVGQKVLAIGNPFGLDQTLTTGVISGLGREIRAPNGRSIFDVIQTDASINPGNSGGPLLDSAGRLIGINTAIYSPSGANAGIGFAVPVDTINEVVPKLIQHVTIARPGLGIDPLGDQMAAQQRIVGVVVMRVMPGGAADRAGIKPAQAVQGGWVLGDVIVKVGDEDVQNLSDLFRAIDAHKVGEVIEVTVENQGARRTVKVELQPLPSP